MSYSTGNVSSSFSSKSLASGVPNTEGKRKMSIGGNFINSFSPSPFEFAGRSYVIAGTVNPGNKNSIGSPAVHSNYFIDEQTANSANIGVTETSSDENVQNRLDLGDEIVDDSMDQIDDDRVDDRGRGDVMDTPGIDIDGQANFLTEFDEGYLSSSPPIDIQSHPHTSPHLRQLRPHQSHPHEEAIEDDSQPLLKSAYPKYDSNGNYSYSSDYEAGTTTNITAQQDLWTTANIGQWLLKPLNYTPAVFLGTLLNILDGLSYGMIMFPVSEATFSSLGPAGLSMFYMSCIVSQLVYSLGGSAFKSGIGSEMIEVTPFFHTMALSILSEMGGENKEAVIATTIVTYAISSIVTGIIFYTLGKLKLGSLVGFFPRHILVGCIGGVGYFLVVTGIEVASRLDGGLEYNLATFSYLFGNYIVFLRWFIPLALTVVLILIQTKYHNSLIVPLFFIGVFGLFHLLVLIVPSWNLDVAKEFGWVFPTVDDDEPWYGFYELYKFTQVDWWCIARQFPTMLALTFFGILHVPINVPALAVTVNMDEVDVDRELVAHGYSNAISGLLGSIQNYLVYTNSVLFIRAGADDRLAGVLLAIATGAVMMVGPVVIGYIPICVVGSLIYLLGYELLKEALYDTYGRLTKIEYSTIIIIVVVMGAWDFVYGVLAGILLACLSFVVEAATTPVVQGMYTGQVARSTVLRHPKQQEFLKDVGNQICVVKLQGTLFFGSIGGVEAAIRSRFEVENFKKDPVKFLILDMKGIVSIDFSAAEGFRRILNLMNEFETQFIISSVEDNDETVKALRDCGLWDSDSKINIQLFNTLNYALEWCESSFLTTYKKVIKSKGINYETYDSLGMTRHKSIVDSDTKNPMNAFDSHLGTTPRSSQVFQAATKTARHVQTNQSTYYNMNDSSFKKQPLPLLMLTFQGLSKKDQQFWSQLTQFFVKEQIPENFTFYDTSSNKPAFFIVETGLVKSIIRFESNKTDLHSSILPMTAFGDLFEINNYRHISYTTVSDSVVWKLSQTKVNELLATSEGVSIYNELLIIQNKLTRERFDTMTANLVLS